MEHPEVPKGFYYHFKHDLEGPVGSYAYEVMGVGRGTEDDAYVVVYRPLYDNTWHENADFSVRPIEMFIDTVEREGKVMKRFRLVTDAETIASLEALSQERYPNT